MSDVEADLAEDDAYALHDSKAADGRFRVAYEQLAASVEEHTGEDGNPWEALPDELSRIRRELAVAAIVVETCLHGNPVDAECKHCGSDDDCAQCSDPNLKGLHTCGQDTQWMPIGYAVEAIVAGARVELDAARGRVRATSVGTEETTNADDDGDVRGGPHVPDAGGVGPVGEAAAELADVLVSTIEATDHAVDSEVALRDIVAEARQLAEDVAPDVLTPFLEGSLHDAIGDDALRLREQLREVQVGHRVVLNHVEELKKLIKQTNHLCGKLGEDCEAAGRACFDEWEEDEFIYGYLCGIGVGQQRSARLLALIGNVLLVKMKKLEAASATEGAS